MIPASHLLTGYLLGEVVRRRSGSETPARRAWADPVVLVAVGSSVLPDFDVLPGLIAGPVGSEFHRGPTHSVVGAVVLAVLAGGAAHFLWNRIVGPAPPRRFLIAAAFSGLASHVFWDFLNPWGVQLAWPLSIDMFSGLLVHEGDFVMLAVLIAASAFAVSGRLAAGVTVAALAIPCYLGLQFWWREAILERASEQLAAERVHTYPNAQWHCPWLLLSGTATRLTAHCVSDPLTLRFEPVLSVPVLDHPLIEATKTDSEVELFLRLREFPFAEIYPEQRGEVLVVWRDLREAVFETEAARPSGLYLRVSSGGEVLNVELNWFLRAWFW
jgi:membrane-bound metal-dependent hydrolase YbcI (DUF457 family)